MHGERTFMNKCTDLPKIYSLVLGSGEMGHIQNGCSRSARTQKHGIGKGGVIYRIRGLLRFRDLVVTCLLFATYTVYIYRDIY